MIKLNYIKILFIILILILINEFAFRTSKGPLLDIDNKNKKDINIVNMIYDGVLDYKKQNNIYPVNIDINILKNILKSEKDIKTWSTYGYYKIINNGNFLIGIKLKYAKYSKNIFGEGFYYKDFYYKTSDGKPFNNIEYIYNNLKNVK